MVNPDAVLRGSMLWEGAWAEGRAKAYGIKVEELPKFYAARTILNDEIITEDIAKAVLRAAYAKALLVDRAKRHKAQEAMML